MCVESNILSRSIHAVGGATLRDGVEKQSWLQQFCCSLGNILDGVHHEKNGDMVAQINSADK